MKINIGIDLDGVLRNTVLKMSQVYEKNYLENYEDESSKQIKTYILDEDGNPILEESGEYFKYEMVLPVDSSNFMEHFKFPNEDDYYNFLYEDFVMQIFGHSPSTEIDTFVSLNEIIESNKEKYEFSIFSKGIGKSKPASLFFISKFGCLIDSVIFYNNNNLQKKLSNYDVIITSNPELIKLYPEKCVKFITSYNKDVVANCEIETIKNLITKIEGIKHVDLI
jgi:hypothetical protein